MNDDLLDDDFGGEEDEPEYEVCQCVNTRLCVRHIAGLCDGHRYEIGAAASDVEDGRPELTGRLRFPQKFDRSWFDE